MVVVKSLFQEGGGGDYKGSERVPFFGFFGCSRPPDGLAAVRRCIFQVIPQANCETYFYNCHGSGFPFQVREKTLLAVLHFNGHTMTDPPIWRWLR
jgi:hypothetical protein